MIRRFHVSHFATTTTTKPSQIVRCRLPVVLNGSWSTAITNTSRAGPAFSHSGIRQTTISAAHAHYSYNKLLNYGDLPLFDFANRLGPSVRCCPSCGSRISRLLLARGVRPADILKRDGGAGEEAPAAAAAAAGGDSDSAAGGAGAAELPVSPAEVLPASARAWRRGSPAGLFPLSSPFDFFDQRDPRHRFERICAVQAAAACQSESSCEGHGRRCSAPSSPSAPQRATAGACERGDRRGGRGFWRGFCRCRRRRGSYRSCWRSSSF